MVGVDVDGVVAGFVAVSCIGVTVIFGGVAAGRVVGVVAAVCVVCVVVVGCVICIIIGVGVCVVWGCCCRSLYCCCWLWCW